MYSKLAWFLVLAADASPSSPPAGTPAPETQPPPANPLGRLLIPLILVFGIMYLFVIAPQRKKEKRRRQMLDAIAKGDQVVTIGGLHATVWQVKDQEIVIDVGGNTKMTVSRGAIARIITGKEGESEA